MTRDIPASVRGQLENLAKKSGRTLQELMQYFVMERFLFRLSQSEYADRFVLKGALMFTVWGSPQSRATRDIDLLARAENSVDAMSGMIKEVCRQTVESDGVEFLSDSVQGAIIKENAEYSGVRVTFIAMIQNARLPMQIDIGFGDVIYPTATIIDYPTMLDFETPRLKGYPKETVIAEKFEAMIKLGQLNSRMKDFYDIHVLSRQFEFDGEILRVAIERTFAIHVLSTEDQPRQVVPHCDRTCRNLESEENQAFGLLLRTWQLETALREPVADLASFRAECSFPSWENWGFHEKRRFCQKTRP